jgi:uncharacterized protein YkwD
MAPRLALAIVLTGVGPAGLLFILRCSRTMNDERVGTYAVDAPAASCPVAMTDAAVRCEVNGIRQAAGLAPIKTTGALKVAAQRHSDDMVRRNYFSHVSPSGLTLRERVARTGYLRRARNHRLGENIAWGSGAAAAPAEIVKAWMNSPGHREIILTPALREVGVGITGAVPQGGNGATYVLDVGRRQ